MRMSRLLPYSDLLRTGIYFFKAFGMGTEQLRILKHYLTGRLFPDLGDELHLKAAMQWLARAQDACMGDGVANVYYLKTGWGVAYPETSGYIIATYLAYADHSGDMNYIDRAIKIGDWELAIQAPNGSVFSSTDLRQPRIFNTGQVILGWCALFERTGQQKYLQAALRSGDYLVNTQEADGTWRKDTYCGARTYHARVDWALLRLAQLSGVARYSESAARNLRWVLDCQLENGWFDQCGFNDDRPITHVIVYTLRGLLECALADKTLAEKLNIMPAVIKGAEAICRGIKSQPVAGIPCMVPASFDRYWNSPSQDSCLTGNAQLAYFLYLLSRYAGNEDFRETADEILSVTKRTQIVDTHILPLRGAIAGTFPLSHGYVANGYPNWAAKFFADALLMKLNFNKSWTIPA